MGARPVDGEVVVHREAAAEASVEDLAVAEEERGEEDGVVEEALVVGHQGVRPAGVADSVEVGVGVAASEAHSLQRTLYHLLTSPSPLSRQDVRPFSEPNVQVPFVGVSQLSC